MLPSHLTAQGHLCDQRCCDGGQVRAREKQGHKCCESRLGSRLPLMRGFGQELELRVRECTDRVSFGVTKELQRARVSRNEAAGAR